MEGHPCSEGEDSATAAFTGRTGACFWEASLSRPMGKGSVWFPSFSKMLGGGGHGQAGAPEVPFVCLAVL